MSSSSWRRAAMACCALMVWGLLGCAAGRKQAPVSPATRDAARCHVRIPGTQITLAESPGSVTLIYASLTDVAGLRTLVRSFADRQNRDAGAAEGQHFGDVTLAPPVAGAPPGTTTFLPGTRASVDDVEGGAILRLAPVTPSETRQLRDDLRASAGGAAPCPPVTTPPPAAPGVGRYPPSSPNAIVVSRALAD
jgi:hypothetical protein